MENFKELSTKEKLTITGGLHELTHALPSDPSGFVSPERHLGKGDNWYTKMYDNL